MTSADGDRFIGRRIGNYAIVARLGAGGMGVVYEAEQASLGRRIALKVLPRTPATLPMLIERFKREARLLSTLQHPNVVTVFDAGEESDLLYFAMELVPGGDLRGLMRRQGKMAAVETIPVVRDVAAALLVAHQKGIIHRDLKPENVMIVPVTGRQPLAKVLDFGIARALNDRTTGQQALTAGAVIGTPAYIAPEVMLGQETIDGRADLYALGVIWFEMLCARPPFLGNSPTALALQQVNEDAPRASRFTPVPSIVDDCIATLLHRDPARRPKDAATLLSLLDDVEAQLLAEADTSPMRQALGQAPLEATFPTDAPTINATAFTLPTPLPPATRSGGAERPPPPAVTAPTHAGLEARSPPPAVTAPTHAGLEARPRGGRTVLYAVLGGTLAVFVVAAVALALFPPSRPDPAAPPATAEVTTPPTTPPQVRADATPPPPARDDATPPPAARDDATTTTTTPPPAPTTTTRIEIAPIKGKPKGTAGRPPSTTPASTTTAATTTTTTTAPTTTPTAPAVWTPDFIDVDAPAPKSGTTPSGTKPSGKNPSGTNPSGTKPSGKNPSGTNPSVTKPSGTNPSVTNPSGTAPTAPTTPIQPDIIDG